MDNKTHFTIYTLMEPRGSKSYRHIYFTCFLLLYALILVINIWLSVVIALERALHKPMYIFLCNLCINYLYGATGFYPKFLHDLILDLYVIPSFMCSLQAFVIYSSAMCECTTLTVMAFDRHVAICQPLDYHSKLTKNKCGILLVFCWTVPFISMFIGVVLSNRLAVCKYHIDKLYCDNWSIVKLSCESVVINNLMALIVSLFYICLTVLIIVSYIKLVVACKASLENRRKFWQTCGPHLFSLINCGFTIFFDAMCNRYGSSDVPQNVYVAFALLMLILPPLFNPLVYVLKLKEVRKKGLKSCVNIIQ
ncbi:olfactory receptor 52D1-like [Carassius auratus]|uniref:Olfactory receptor n=1 Tax=Carassius auratus TaxID=7957 RepID=A0A6P6LZD3_CARAU|nr:olfactory receptor 52D1-like [Carassius auratus]XP_052392376.1 olfactory receptor 52D1-like [Carassius gibelio]